MPVSISRIGQSITARHRLAAMQLGIALLVWLIRLSTLPADDRPTRLPPVGCLDQLPPAGSALWVSQLRGSEPAYRPDTAYPDLTLPLEPAWQGEPAELSGRTWEPSPVWEPDFRERLPLDDDLPTGDVWTWQVMPEGLLYRSYLAGAKEPRFASYWNRDSSYGVMWDTAIGGRLGLLRYGTEGADDAEGWQVDLEGAAHSRLDPRADSHPLYSVDFRVGFPITWARGNWQFKTGYYHISAHLGDEYLLMNPHARRINYTRDAALLAVGYFWTERLRLYAESAYAVGTSGGAQPWEFQCGADYAPARDTGLRGAPFAALNGHVREELNFGGNLVLQTGWCWRRAPRGSLFRIGVQYYKGKSDQYEFYDHSEERFGWGMWADF